MTVGNMKAVSGRDVQKQASHWVVERHASENWSADDQVRLDHWLNQSFAHKTAYWRAAQAWNRTYRIVALKAPEGRVPNRAGKSKLLRIAFATGFTTALGILAIFLLLPRQYDRYEVPVGGHKIISLADGSRIELNTDSALRLSTRGGARQAILDRGEAYFDIKHDLAHPFEVESGDRRIVDVGTKFLVRDRIGGIEVAMFEGRTILNSPKGSAMPPSNLVAGDIAVATPTNTTISRAAPKTLADIAAWRNGLLVFRRTTLADAASEFNRYSKRKLVVVDSDAAALKIDGKFRSDGVETFAEVAEDVLHLRVEKKADEILLAR
jgi:transmembrane sensor